MSVWVFFWWGVTQIRRCQSKWDDICVAVAVLVFVPPAKVKTSQQQLPNEGRQLAAVCVCFSWTVLCSDTEYKGTEALIRPVGVAALVQRSR